MKTEIEIIESSWEWDVPARGDESRVPNKYRSSPETDETGVVKGCDIPRLFSFASAVALASLIVASILAASN